MTEGQNAYGYEELTVLKECSIDHQIVNKYLLSADDTLNEGISERVGGVVLHNLMSVIYPLFFAVPRPFLHGQFSTL